MVYLIEEQGSVTMTAAAAPDRVPAVWQRGLEILLFAIAGLGALWAVPFSQAQQGDVFDSPVPTPTPDQGSGPFGPFPLSTLLNDDHLPSAGC